ncbi:MAG: hypothetical protein GY895_00355, partial [Phycisphaera sp.]|nr:hypothetical protein [Phycisphaera sp.]
MSTQKVFNRNHLLGTIAIAGLLSTSAVADTITVCLDGSCDFTDPAAAAQAAAE